MHKIYKHFVCIIVFIVNKNAIIYILVLRFYIDISTKQKQLAMGNR